VAGEERRGEMVREYEEVPRSIRVLAAISAGILAAVLVVPAFVGAVWGPDDSIRESSVEWDDSQNDVDKTVDELDTGEDTGGNRAG
jgi:hypothetical protein